MLTLEVSNASMALDSIPVAETFNTSNASAVDSIPVAEMVELVGWDGRAGGLRR